MIRRIILITISSLLLLSITAFCRLPSSFSKKKAASIVDKIDDSGPGGGGTNTPTFPGTDPDIPAGTGDRNMQGDWESSGGELRFFRFRPDPTYNKTMKIKYCDASGNTIYSAEGVYNDSSGSGTSYYTVAGKVNTLFWQNAQEFRLGANNLIYVRTTRWNFCP